ncbi:MAG: hypothetical protein CDV28_14621, partial [Candidatus Electronema aureum]
FHKNGVWLAGIRPLKTETKSEVNFFNIILFLMVNSMCFLGSRPLCHSWFTITCYSDENQVAAQMETKNYIPRPTFLTIAA